MSEPRTEEVTALLAQLARGESGAWERLLPLVYDQLRVAARSALRSERRDHTLQPTALVHEAWLRIAPAAVALGDRELFLAVASRAMRRVLADHARGRLRAKRGGGRRPIALLDEVDPGSGGAFDLVALDDTLRRLSSLNERHARVVELRYFGSMTIDETARVLGVSHGTVESDWRMARAWLRRELAAG